MCLLFYHVTLADKTCSCNMQKRDVNVFETSDRRFKRYLNGNLCSNILPNLPANFLVVVLICIRKNVVGLFVNYLLFTIFIIRLFQQYFIYLLITLFNVGILKQLIANKTNYIHVQHIKQPQSMSPKFFMLFLNSETDLLDFM